MFLHKMSRIRWMSGSCDSDQFLDSLWVLCIVNEYATPRKKGNLVITGTCKCVSGFGLTRTYPNMTFFDFDLEFQGFQNLRSTSGIYDLFFNLCLSVWLSIL